MQANVPLITVSVSIKSNLPPNKAGYTGSMLEKIQPSLKKHHRAGRGHYEIEVEGTTYTMFKNRGFYTKWVLMLDHEQAWFLCMT